MTEYLLFLISLLLGAYSLLPVFKGFSQALKIRESRVYRQLELPKP